MKSSSPLISQDAERDEPPAPWSYEIKVKGRLDGERWSTHFDGLELLPDESGVTMLRGPLPDQAALYGVLSRLRDLNLPLLSVNRIS